jgi:hypothetical protein
MYDVGYWRTAQISAIAQRVQAQNPGYILLIKIDV